MSIEELEDGVRLLNEKTKEMKNKFKTSLKHQDKSMHMMSYLIHELATQRIKLYDDIRTTHLDLMNIDIDLIKDVDEKIKNIMRRYYKK
jgi:hypothetical protein